jgi:hypothetical protein
MVKDMTEHTLDGLLCIQLQVRSKAPLRPRLLLTQTPAVDIFSANSDSINSKPLYLSPLTNRGFLAVQLNPQDPTGETDCDPNR